MIKGYLAAAGAAQRTSRTKRPSSAAGRSRAASVTEGRPSLPVTGLRFSRGNRAPEQGERSQPRCGWARQPRAGEVTPAESVTGGLAAARGDGCGGRPGGGQAGEQEPRSRCGSSGAECGPQAFLCKERFTLLKSPENLSET